MPPRIFMCGAALLVALLHSAAGGGVRTEGNVVYIDLDGDSDNLEGFLEGLAGDQGALQTALRELEKAAAEAQKARDGAAEAPDAKQADERGRTYHSVDWESAGDAGGAAARLEWLEKALEKGLEDTLEQSLFAKLAALPVEKVSEAPGVLEGLGLGGARPGGERPLEERLGARWAGAPKARRRKIAKMPEVAVAALLESLGEED
eukprot:CAMPEP_0119268154 /NCGR_PEP_ID=MMETSP1329-20130426/6030_1 /TAXON_ID=114041 /ORGANISM="Genus nov. species nov., Strain RCC1024" /LENGTH=204 /DNA_ID=CAMNT_0007268111 /DNA_START=157 /DNA_END=768 /DNA_ORIENTATION=+